MNENKISYLNRTFDDYKKSLKNYLLQYYPQIAESLNDASIGSWIVDMVASIGDNLSYYIDKAYNETNLDSAQQLSSVHNLARSNGLKVPGPKGSVALCEFSCFLPVNGTDGMPNYAYAPLIKRGTRVSSRTQVFELVNDADFAEEFDYNGYANRDVEPVYNSNGKIVKYRVKKREIVIAGESRIYKQIIGSASDVYPFMEIVVPDENVMEIESIIFKDGDDYQRDPVTAEFMIESEKATIDQNTIYRFFEVDSLADHYRWGDAITTTNGANTFREDSTTYKYSSYMTGAPGAMTGVPVYSITKGEWVPITQKFITEFTDKGYLKVIFGSGQLANEEQKDSSTPRDSFAKYQISKILHNNFLGKLPPVGTTMYILYRVGGGRASNVGANTITSINYLDVSFCRGGSEQSILNDVRRSIGVTNPSPSVGGKDAPTVDEVRAMIKYNSGEQRRCVTVKDYENRITLMPSRYGAPFRVSVTEENNKVMIYMLGINYDGTLSDTFPEQMIYNIGNYLAMFRSINDFVEIKSGRIVNVGVNANIFVNKNYNAADVVSSVISVIRDFFDINKRQMGESLFVSELIRRITDVDGVLNVVSLEILNKFGTRYSSVKSSDPIVDSADPESGMAQIDILASNYTLNSDADSMFEIKYPTQDIKINTIIR